MDIEVKMGDLAVSKNSDNLIASGVGSCLIIALYDTKLKIGTLAHAILTNPHSTRKSNNEIRDTSNEQRDTRYIDIAIGEMLQRMKALGSQKGDIECKLVGGANMFPNIKSSIGKENILSAKEKLQKEGIKLVGECIGGSQGRSVEFSIASGTMTVKTKF